MIIVPAEYVLPTNERREREREIDTNALGTMYRCILVSMCYLIFEIDVGKMIA